MADTSEPRKSDVRQAEGRFAKSRKLDDEVKLYQKQRWDAETAKIARLRALRLARDAEEKSRSKDAPAIGAKRKDRRSKYLGGYE